MRLYLIRHARPEVTDGVCYGRTNLHVHPDEHRQVLTALIPSLPNGVPIYSSPLRRCSELATLLASALESDTVIHDDRLAEMDFGAWEMRAWNNIQRAEIDAWAADMPSYRPGGGECVLSVAQRIRLFLGELQTRRLCSAIVVCHAGTIRILSACLRNSSTVDAAFAAVQTPHSVAYGELIVLDCDLNDVGRKKA